MWSLTIDALAQLIRLMTDTEMIKNKHTNAVLELPVTKATYYIDNLDQWHP